MKRALCMIAAGVGIAFPATAQPLVGIWNCSVSESAVNTELGVTYETDGRFQKFVTVNDYYEDREFAVELVASGRWIMDGSTLTETLSNIKVQRMYLDGADATDDPQLADVRAEIEALAAVKPPPVRVSFDGSNRFLTDTVWGTTDCARAVIVIE